jgi:hypothetical protein
MKRNITEQLNVYNIRTSTQNGYKQTSLKFQYGFEKGRTAQALFILFSITVRSHPRYKKHTLQAVEQEL